MPVPSEPNDDHRYSNVILDDRTVQLIRRGFAGYQALLEADLAALKSDQDLVAIVDNVDSLPIVRELARVGGILSWLDREIANPGRSFPDYFLNLSHGYVRFTKSVCALEIAHLRSRRDILAKQTRSTQVLSSVDAAIASLEQTMESGVFGAASQAPLLVSDVPVPSVPQLPAATPSPPSPTPVRTILLPSIEIADAELRSRCVDLFRNFSDDGQHERLDTVVTEATRVLEDRVRRRSRAPETTIGVELAKYAFCGTPPPIEVSTISAEQEAAHLLFRGVFGFVRNQVHHRLIGPLDPQRVLQILGMIDYLLWLSSPTASGSLASSAGNAAPGTSLTFPALAK